MNPLYNILSNETAKLVEGLEKHYNSRISSLNLTRLNISKSLDDVVTALDKLTQNKDVVLDALKKLKKVPKTAFEPVEMHHVLDYTDNLILLSQNSDSVIDYLSLFDSHGFKNSHTSMNGFNISLNVAEGIVKLANERAKTIPFLYELNARNIPIITASNSHAPDSYDIYSKADLVLKAANNSKSFFSVVDALFAVNNEYELNQVGNSALLMHNHLENLMSLSDKSLEIKEVGLALKDAGFMISYDAILYHHAKFRTAMLENKKAVDFVTHFKGKYTLQTGKEKMYRLGHLSANNFYDIVISFAEKLDGLKKVDEKLSELGINIRLEDVAQSHKLYSTLIDNVDKLDSMIYALSPIKGKMDFVNHESDSESLIKLAEYSEVCKNFLENMGKVKFREMDIYHTTKEAKELVSIMELISPLSSEKQEELFGKVKEFMATPAFPHSTCTYTPSLLLPVVQKFAS